MAKSTNEYWEKEKAAYLLKEQIFQSIAKQALT
jgi:hypothetical protein